MRYCTESSATGQPFICRRSKSERSISTALAASDLMVAGSCCGSPTKTMDLAPAVMGCSAATSFAWPASSISTVWNGARLDASLKIFCCVEDKVENTISASLNSSVLSSSSDCLASEFFPGVVAADPMIDGHAADSLSTCRSIRSISCRAASRAAAIWVMSDSLCAALARDISSCRTCCFIWTRSVCFA